MAANPILLFSRVSPTQTISCVDLFRLARSEKRVKLRCSSTPYQLEAPLSHSQMLKTRRTKQRTKKDLAGIAKRTKKMGKQNLKSAGADAEKRGTP